MLWVRGCLLLFGDMACVVIVSMVLASMRSACAGLFTLMGCSLELDFGTQVSTVNIPGKFELPTLSNS